MSNMRPYLPADAWMQNIFNAKAARLDGVVRRNIKDIERIVDTTRFATELQRRGYHAVLNGDQIIIFCNKQSVRLWC